MLYASIVQYIEDTVGVAFDAGFVIEPVLTLHHRLKCRNLKVILNVYGKYVEHHK